MFRRFSIIFVQIYKYIATKRFDLACIGAHPARRRDNAGLYIGHERPALARAHMWCTGRAGWLGRGWDLNYRVHSAHIEAQRHAVLLVRLEFAEVREDLPTPPSHPPHSGETQAVEGRRGGRYEAKTKAVSHWIYRGARPR